MNNINQKVDKIYHIHTYFCGHSTNSVSSIVQYALRHNYKRIVFTEHCPLKNNSKIRRPHTHQIDLLLKQIERARQTAGDKIKIEFGFECEFPMAQRKRIIELASQGQANYFILGIHFFGNMWKDYKYVVYDTTAKDLDAYYNMAKDAAESGLFSWFAHPDIWCGSYGVWDEKAKELTQKIIDLSIKYDLPLGFNGNGLSSKRGDLHYPCKPFWEMVAQSKAKVVIEADSHHHYTYSVKWLNYVYDTAISYGLKNNIIDDVKLRYFKK